MDVVDKRRVSCLADSLLLLHRLWWWRKRKIVSEMLKKR